MNIDSINHRGLVSFLLLSISLLQAQMAQGVSDTIAGDEMIAEYFRTETAKLETRSLADIKTLDDWKDKRQIYRKQLFEMLGLDPMPPKTNLKPVVTGTVQHEEFTVEKIHFQSMPGLYVTGNLYIPKDLDKPAPTILYVCGHGPVKIDGVSYGNKVSYQHHSAWFARNGYVCLTIDTVQMGEIEGIHHGTYRYDMWWWNSRGYTSAGAEAFNCIRALDYLETRKEVDTNRIGVTGRSGGGAYSWWISALDERIKVAVPVAGITDLRNHVVDGCVEGHCDCMYFVNTYRWDYAMVAALVAPRPLLISNSDKDKIFPLDGVVRLHEKVRRIYRLYDKEANLGLNITEGPHNDTQELRTHAFVWFNRFLKNDMTLIRKPAEKFFQPQQLKVFDKLPEDQINTKVQELLTAKAPDAKGLDARQAKKLMASLKEKSFNGWPTGPDISPLNVKHIFSAARQGLQFQAYDFTSQQNIRLRIYIINKTDNKTPDSITLSILDQPQWIESIKALNVVFADELKECNIDGQDKAAWESIVKQFGEKNCAFAFFAPRGIGLSAWNSDPRKQIQIRRRFMLLGQTLDGMRLWDVRRAIQAINSLEMMQDAKLGLIGSDVSAGIALYASLFEPTVTSCDLQNLPATHRQSPIFLNVLRYLDIPQAIEIANQRCQIRIHMRLSSDNGTTQHAD